MSDDPIALRAAADQGHAAVEELLDELLQWWTQEVRPGYDETITCRADEVSILTYIFTISGTTSYPSLLATAICRLADPERSSR